MPRPGRDVEDFGPHLRALRTLRKITQAELGKKIGVTQSHVAKLERGRNPPTPDEVERMVVALEPDAPARFRFLAYLAHVPPVGRRWFRLKK